MAHARLGPSNHRWPNCAGSVREEQNYPDIPGDAAIDGTGSHLLLEMCLDNNVPAIQYDQQIIGVNHEDRPNGWLVDPDRAARVQMCLDYIERRVRELKEQHQNHTVIVEPETISNPGAAFHRDDWWGTCDVTITCKHNHTGDVAFLEIIDYKDGRLWVDARNNTQLVSYLAGAVMPIQERVADCRMTIVQPKTNPVVRYWCSTRTEDVFSVQVLVDLAAGMNAAARRTDDPDAPTTPGKWCQWCKANPKRGGHCMTAADKSLEMVTKMTDTSLQINNNLPAFEYMRQAVSDPKSLTVEQLSELASAREPLLAVFDKVNDEIEARIGQGLKVPGYAMKPGKGSRVWTEDEESLIKKLKAKRLKLDDIYPKKLASPAQILKNNKLTEAQRANIEKQLVTFKAGSLKLTKVAHDEPELQEVNKAEMMFGDVKPEVVSFL